METNVSENEILKYYNVLKELKTVLKHTGKIKMGDFSKKNEVSPDLSMVLIRAGIIKNNGHGKGSLYEWIGIDPTREMAIKLIQTLKKQIAPEKKVKLKEKTEKDALTRFEIFRINSCVYEIMEITACDYYKNLGLPHLIKFLTTPEYFYSFNEFITTVENLGKLTITEDIYHSFTLDLQGFVSELESKAYFNSSHFINPNKPKREDHF